MDRSRHTVTEYLSVEKREAAFIDKLFKKLDHFDNLLYGAQLADAQKAQRPKFCRPLQSSNCKTTNAGTVLEFFFTRFYAVNGFQKLEKDTDLLYPSLDDKELEDCIQPETKTEWERLRARDCSESFTADASGIFFPRICCDKHKKDDKREPGLFKEYFRCTEVLCFCSKTYYCYDVVSNTFDFCSKSLNTSVLEQNNYGPLDKYRRVLDEKVKITSTNIGFGTESHSFAAYEQVKKGFSYFYPTRIVEKIGLTSISNALCLFPLLISN